jgi:hypothetical protein
MSEEQTPFAAEAPAPSPEAAPVADPAPVATPTPIVIPASLSGLVGEGMKYATLDVAIESIAPAQAHLTKVEAENAELRASNEKSRSQEDILADWKNQIGEQTTLAQTPQVAATPAVTSQDISEVVNQQLQAQEAAKVAAQNTREVVAAMTKHYGDKDKADEAYNTQAKALGLGVAGMNKLTAQSPKAVLKMLGIEKQSSPTPPLSSGSVMSGTLNQTPEPAAPKSVMAGASHKQQQAAWNSFAPKE